MERKITRTYWKLIEKFAKNPSGNVEHRVYPAYVGHDSETVVKVSHAHKTCLCYLIWVEYQSVEASEEFIKAAVEWRKKEDRYTGPRTLIEKVARVTIRRLPKIRHRRASSCGGVRGARTQMEKGIGIHSPDYPVELRQEGGRRASFAANSKPRFLDWRKWWVLTPEGESFLIGNLHGFCELNGLTYKHMFRRALLERPPLESGWNCRQAKFDGHGSAIPPNWDGLPPLP